MWPKVERGGTKGNGVGPKVERGGAEGGMG